MPPRSPCLAQAARCCTHRNSELCHELAPFWPLKPFEWFSQIEASLVLHHINSERTRYMHILQELPPETITSILDTISQQAQLIDV